MQATCLLKVICIIGLSLSYTFLLVSAERRPFARNNHAQVRWQVHNRLEEPQQERMEEIQALLVRLQIPNPLCDCSPENACALQTCCLCTTCLVAQYAPLFRLCRCAIK